MHGQLYRGHISVIALLLFSERLSATCAQHLYITEETPGLRLIYIFLFHIVGKTFERFAQFSSLLLKIFNISLQAFLGRPPKIASWPKNLTL